MEIALLPLVGRYWRMLGVRWQTQPFGSGSHLTGGRWNPPGTRALYLSADYNTAIREMHQDLVRPGTLVAYDLRADTIVDFRQGDPAVLTCEWRRIFKLEKGIPPSWTLADQAQEAGADGALVPSIQHPGGTNLVLWRWHDAQVAGEGAHLTLLDPEAMLTGS